ncbi:F-box associated interaction domain-containing protein [Artemisia annua]|uniref:F-box associated interaction domain-containing protein n=1 Tax=Artemisia annua TaxID=35608 RepID=A0A2U1PEZ3_ARTAN|nr:F-box associated interaction domain-containing protein [Artemisia annua]
MACEESSITIPRDIITEILYCLPTKSAGRFRCVSKEWLSLLSEPQFIKTHQKARNRNCLVFWSYDSSHYSVPFNNCKAVSRLAKLPVESSVNRDYEEFLPFNNSKAVFRPAKLPVESSVVNRDYVEFLGSCNGLVLASSHDLRQVGEFVVVNLITGDYVEFLMFRHQSLPIFKRDSMVLLVMHVMYRAHKFFVSNLTTRDYVEFPVWWQEFSNSRDERYMTRFGYDSVKDDYKVVTISYIRSYGSPPDETYVHVYSLRNNSWKQMNWLRGVFVNGFLHWIASKGSDRIPVIVAFSLADEKFSCEVPSPDMNNDADILSHSDCKLVALGDKLGIFHTVEGVVWLINEYGVQESWTKIVVHGFNEISIYEPKIFYDNRKLLFVKRKIMWIYDLEGGTSLKDVVISNKEYSWVKCAYVESLVMQFFLAIK